MLLITKVSPNWNNDWMNYLNEMERYPILQSLCGLAGTRNLAVCLEQATAEGGTATGGSRPTDALGKFPRRSEYTKLTPFRAWVVHLGVKDLAITSYGEVIANPKSYKKHLQRLKRWQRKISRRKKGSKNRKKAIRKVADLHRKITNIRINSAHQCTTSLTRKLAPKMLVIESLKPKNMSCNRKLASSVLDANFNRIATQLEYKCKWLGIKLVKAPQFYASSQYCSECGCYQKKDLKLTDREWTCPHCGCHHDRDVNAARNLRFYGLWLLGYANQQTAASYAVAACPVGECPREGSGSEPRPKDLRLQFFETQEQCRSLKQEITSSIRHCA